MAEEHVPIGVENIAAPTQDANVAMALSNSVSLHLASIPVRLRYGASWCTSISGLLPYISPWKNIPIISIESITVIFVRLSEGTTVSGCVAADTASVDEDNVLGFNNSFYYRENEFRAGLKHDHIFRPEGGLSFQVKPVSSVAAPAKIFLFWHGDNLSDDLILIKMHFRCAGLMTFISSPVTFAAPKVASRSDQSRRD